MRLLPVLILVAAVVALPTGEKRRFRARNSNSNDANNNASGGNGNTQQAARNTTCNAATALKVGQLSGGIRVNVAIQEQEQLR